MKDSCTVRDRIASDTRGGPGGRHRRAVLSALILAVVTIAVACTTIVLLARAAFIQQAARLTEIVENRAQVIEAIADEEEKRGRVAAAPGHADPFHALLNQVRSIYSESHTAGRTGEFVLGRREGDSIVILLRRHRARIAEPTVLPAAGTRAEPMRRALAGRSGFGVLPDYRGVLVLAAWEPVGVHDLGAVAKIDLAEVNAPFVRAGLIALAVALLAVALGTVLFFRITDPLVRELGESEDRFRRAVEAQPELAWTCRPDGSCDSLGDHWIAYTGIPAEHQLGFGWLEQLHPDDHARTLVAWSAAAAEGADFRIAFRLRRHDGAYRWFDTRAVRRLDDQGRITRWFCSSADITDLRATEGLLHEAEFFAQEALDALADTFFVFNPATGKALRWNRAYREVSGYSGEEIAGLKAPDSYYTGEDLERAAASLAVLAEKGTTSVELELICKDGHRVPFEYRVALLPGADDEPAVAVSVGRDITERRRAEAERERLLHRLRSKNRELEELIYAASHDLRTPLISIKGFAAELSASLTTLAGLVRNQQLTPGTAERVAGLLDKNIPESVHFIDAGANRMSVLLAGLLHISRLDRAVIDIETIDMNRLAGDVIDAMEYQVQLAGAAIETSDLPPCRGDAVQVSQALSNLLGNAITHRSPDRAPRIRVTGQVRGDEAHYCIEDNGPGIPPDLQESVFKLFYRADPASKGEGIGLSVVRAALDRIGGRVWLESEVGHGSRFWFSLPAAGKDT